MTGSGSSTTITDVNELRVLADDAATPAAPTIDAATAAAVAASRSGVQIRELSDLDQLTDVFQLCNRVWAPNPTDPPITTSLLRAMTTAGNYVGGAYDGDDLVGACIGFFGIPHRAGAGRTIELHSHIAAVESHLRGRNVGFALKQHQRAWALRRGIVRISWTFDPLVRRNAYFNIGKLHALPAVYLRDFYGAMHDAINGSDETDRLLVEWDLAAPLVQDAAAGAPEQTDVPALLAAGASVGLSEGDDGQPVSGQVDGRVVLIGVPKDIEGLRRTDAASAAGWRTAVRDVLGGLMAEGARVTGFAREAGYVVTRTAP